MKWLAALLGVDDQTPTEPPRRVDPCPSCGCEYMTAGGPTVTHESNGESARIVQSSAVLCCLGCGERWYGTPRGLKRPHEAALPPAWASIDLHARMTAERDKATAAADERKRSAAETQLNRPRRAHEVFRRPPNPNPDRR